MKKQTQVQSNITFDTNPPFLIGVAGGSGSGKSTLVEQILRTIDSDQVVIVPHDAYYRNQATLPMKEREAVNYDHPDSLETELLIGHLQALRSGQHVDQPVYDFSHHTRADETRLVHSRPIILVEGILIYAIPELRAELDLKLFVDTEADIRLARRLKRDVQERGRTFEFSLNQYLQFTKPMHEQFVEPSKRYADVIIPEGGLNANAIQMIQAQIEFRLQQAR